MIPLPRTIRRPLAGPDVEAVRRVLIRTPFRKPTDPGGVKRKMGALLEAQVREFQRHHGITPSGVVGAATWKKMNNLGLVLGYEEHLVTLEREKLQAENANRVADLVIQAALEGASAKWEPSIHYSQDQNLRWRGIHLGLLAPDNQPDFADCSSYTTWLFWQARMRVYGTAGADVVNGQDWKAGFTGTQEQHGTAVPLDRAEPGRTLCFYSTRADRVATHVVMFVGTLAGHGTNCVVSHGQEDGPRIARVNYRDDYIGSRTYTV